MSERRLAASIAWRYLFSGRKRFAAFITWSSVVGLALGVIVLTVVVSVMNGFDRELRTRLLGAVPHLFLEGAESAVPVAADRAEAMGVLAGQPYPFFQGQAMISHRSVVTPLTLYGFPGERLASGDLVPALAPGAILFNGESGAANLLYLGAPLVAHLGLSVGDVVTLILAEPGGVGVRPQLKRFQLGGTFELGAELDTSLGLVDLGALSKDEQERFGRTGWRMQLTEPTAAPQLAADLRQEVPGSRISDWSQSYGSFFRAVALEKAMMFVVLLLVVAVASFNIVAGQLMVVAEKEADIAILRTLGAQAGTVRQIFILQGVVIALIGIVLGLLLGVWCASNVSTLVDWLGRMTSYRLLEGTYFVELPSEVRLGDLIVISGLAVLLALFAALVPAGRAAGVSPVDGLRGT